MAHDVFVSHSVKDKAVAEAVVARLEADSVTCWIAPRDVVPGADWGESIIDAIESSRIMILIFSRNADASSQIKREVERAVNKGVYIIPFRVDDIPPTRSLEYFISTSQWMDAFSPPLERHLDNLAKTVKAILKRPNLSAADVPAQPEKPSIPKQPIPPPRRKSILIAIIIAGLVIVGGAGWYLVQKKKGPSEKPAVTGTGTPTAVPITPAAVTPVPTPVSTLTTPPQSPPIANMINDEEVRNFVASHYRAEERGDVDYLLSQYDDSFKWGREQRDKASQRNELNEFLKRWPVHSFSVGDIRVVHSDIPDRVTAYFEYRFFYRDPASSRSDSGRISQEWVISKTSGALKIVSGRSTSHRDSPAPSPLPTGSPTLTTPPPSANTINDEEVRNLVTSHYRAQERGDVDYLVSQFEDPVDWGGQQRDKAFLRTHYLGFLKQWPVVSFTFDDIRVAHSDTPDKVKAYFQYRFLYRDPASGRSKTGRYSGLWVLSKTSGSLKIVSFRGSSHDSPTPSPLEAKPESSDSGKWLASAEYQREFDSKKSGFYPSNIEGRCHNGRVEFRAVWKNLPLGTAFESHHGMTKQQFEDRANALRGQGYSLEFSAGFQDCNDVARYQATWLKKN
jgi:TIR domain-containing protein/polyglycine hydrolase-like protein